MVELNKSKRTTSRWAKARRQVLTIVGRFFGPFLGTFFGREASEAWDLKDLLEGLMSLF